MNPHEKILILFGFLALLIGHQMIPNEVHPVEVRELVGAIDHLKNIAQVLDGNEPCMIFIDRPPEPITTEDCTVDRITTLEVKDSDRVGFNILNTDANDLVYFNPDYSPLVTVTFENGQLKLNGDPNNYDEAARGFFLDTLKPLIDTYIRSSKEQLRAEIIADMLSDSSQTTVYDDNN